MATKKLLAVKFAAVDKRNIDGYVRHTRTGACTAKGKCYHGRVRKQK